MNERKLIPLTEVKQRQIQWLWPNRIPLGAITLIDGNPGESKSTLTYDLAARVTTGREMPDCEAAIAPAGVVLLQAEDSLEATVLPNLNAAGADINRIVGLDKRKCADSPLQIPDDLSLIEAAVADCQAKLVVIDPLSGFLSGNGQNIASVRKALGPLATFAESSGVAVVLVRHLTKAGSGNALYRGTGSIGVIGLARSALLVGRDPTTEEKHRFVVALNKSNIGDAMSLSYRTVKHQDGSTTIEWLGTTKTTADDVASACGQQDESSMLCEAMFVLYSVLSEGPVRADEVATRARQAQVSKRTLDRAKRALHIKSRKVGSGKGSYWEWMLPDDQEHLQPFKERDIDELADQLFHGDDDPPLHGDEWKYGIDEEFPDEEDGGLGASKE